MATGKFYYNDFNGKVNRSARLSSPVFYPVQYGNNCSFRMWYYIQGYAENQPVLNVYKRTMLGGPMTLIWNKNNLNCKRNSI